MIDGDTIAIGEERIRIENIDTPETGGRAACAEERRLASAATRQARAYFSEAGSISIRRSGVDRYGRTLATVRLDGRDYGRLMIADGLAVRWAGRQHEWCD